MPALALNMTDVNALDLAPIENHLVTRLGWSEDKAARGITGYRRFLYLCAEHPDQTLVPNGVIDEVWHTHIVHTRKYAADCEQLCGRFLHHTPNTANTSGEYWENTQALYLSTFGEELPGNAGGCEDCFCTPPGK